MTRLTIIIPYLGNSGVGGRVCDERALEETLVSVLEHRPPHAEVILAHDGSYTDPYDLADEIHFVVNRKAKSCCELLNSAFAECETEVAHSLLSGTIVKEGWTDGIIDHFRDPLVASVSLLIVDRLQPEYIVAQGVSSGWGRIRQLVGAGRVIDEHRMQRRRISGPSLLAGFYRLGPVLELGGFEPRLGDDLADVDLALSLEEMGYRCEFADDCRVAAGAEPITPLGFEGGRNHERLFWRHRNSGLAGLLSLIAHPFIALASAIGDLPHPGSALQLFGRLAALTEFASLVRHRAALNRCLEPATIVQLPTVAASKSIDTQRQRRAA